jgi:Trypsin-co-occurring domain 2
MDEEIGLASAIEALRNELETAWLAGQERPVRFLASEITLTLTTVARLDKEGSGKIRWYLLEAGGSVTSGSERTQTLTLKLAPERVAADGTSTPLRVTGHQPVPGQ